MKAMSITGIILFTLTLLGVISDFGDYENDYKGDVSVCILVLLFALAYAIVGVVNSFKKPKLGNRDITTELEKLGELKVKGILTEEEFTNRKNKLLNLD